jgi:hypothetical protein
MKRWFLLIEGTICGIYQTKKAAEADFQKAKEDFPSIDDLVELAEVIKTTANESTVYAIQTMDYKYILAKIKVFIKDDRSGAHLKRTKRDSE